VGEETAKRAIVAAQADLAIPRLHLAASRAGRSADPVRYLSSLSRPEQAVHFFRDVVGVAAVDKEVLNRGTADYEAWVEAFARNHRLPIRRPGENSCLRRHHRPYREPQAAVKSLITGFPKNLIHMRVLAEATLYHVDFQLKDTLLRTL
jgi:hypothetical protein